jgi:hypothetical protein
MEQTWLRNRWPATQSFQSDRNRHLELHGEENHDFGNTIARISTS